MLVLQRRTWVAAMVAGLSAPLGWAAPSTVLVQHAQGATAVPQRPQRVVVYDLATLDTMQALGMAVRGVPQAQLPPYLAGYADARYTVAGSLFEPDYAALSQIRPDLIIVGGRSAAKYEALGKIAPTLDFSVRGDHLLQDMARNITQLAQLSGQPAQAEPGLLLMAVNERILPNAPGSRFGFLFDVLGARSALRAQDLPARGTVYDLDAVARLDPAWIYVIDRNAATGSAPGGGALIPSQQVFDNAQVRGTQAGRKGQVVFLDPKGWYLLGSAGPTALLGNLAQLQQVYRAAGLR